MPFSIVLFFGRFGFFLLDMISNYYIDKPLLHNPEIEVHVQGPVQNADTDAGPSCGNPFKAKTLLSVDSK